MELNNLPKIIQKKKKRKGRGYGSGKGGHTVGRGAKGTKARNKVPLYFEGAAQGASLIKRIPLFRGKSKNKPFKKKPIVINIKYLNLFPNDSVVTLKSLIKHNIVKKDKAEKYGVKILGEGKLKNSLIVKLPSSVNAKKKIEEAGGKVEIKKS